MRPKLLLVPAAITCAIAVTCALVPARADVIRLENGATYRGKIVKETSRSVTIKTKVGPVTVRRDQISKIVRTAELERELERKLEAGKGDPDKLYAAGKWAKKQGLGKSARKAFELAIKADAYHEKSRQALGHRKHQGRLYSDDEYNSEVLGLVLYEGKWVSKADRERLKAGLVKNADGNWVLPPGKEDEEKPVVRRPKPSASSAPKPSQPKPAQPKPRAKVAKPRAAEDKSWYLDNTAVCGFGEAPVIESRHYKIRTNVKSEYAKRYGVMMDRYYRRFLKVFREFLPKGRIPKSEIWIYSSRNEFRAAERVGPTTGGFYNTGTKRVTAFHGPFGNTGTTREVLAHEGTHQFQDICLGGRFSYAPTWILEGLAVLFESAYYDGDDVVIGLVPRDRLSSLKRGIAAGNLIPLSQLIRTPQPQFTAYHYAHAWGLIYMVLYYGDSPKIRKRCQKWFSDLFALAKNGTRVTADVVEERCGGREKFLELEQQWKDWIRDLPYDFDPRSR